jgi:SAM-dependent methyltransferase
VTGRPDPVRDEFRRFYEEHHQSVEETRRARRYYYGYLNRILRQRVAPGQRVLEVGCGAGHLLAALEPSQGVGIDLSSRNVAQARQRYGSPTLTFLEGDAADEDVVRRAGGPFDAIVMVNVATQLTDVQRTLEVLQAAVHSRTRLFLYSYSRLWQPLLRLAEVLRLKHRPPPESWLPPEELRNILSLADYELVRQDNQIVCPIHLPLVSDFLNRFVGHLPGLEWLALMFGLIARPAPHRFPAPRALSTSVVIPCRNEAGHIGRLVARLPRLEEGSEYIFVEGGSRDGTEAEIRKAIAENPDRPFSLYTQTGRGKGDAVRLGFARARGDVLLILDSDMGVAPEDIPRFVAALTRGRGDLINGSRLVYPLQGRAMRFLNLGANKLFAWFFSWVLGQQVRDTLCGTKALLRQDYERIAAQRSFFGDFDPFGDFDLLLGAARLNLRVVDLAVRYHEREYGETNISRFRHGWLLLRMSLFAARKLKFV